MDRSRAPLLLPVHGIVSRVKRGFYKLFVSQRHRHICAVGPDGTVYEIPWTVQSAHAKGDLLVNTGSGYIRLAIGSNDQVLTADSTVARGVKWADASGGGVQDPFATFRLVEDFVKESTEAGEFGTLGWSSAGIGGGGTNVYLTAEQTGWKDAGIARVTGSAGGSPTSCRGRILYLGTTSGSNDPPFYGQPPEGMYFGCKVRISSGSLASQTAWVGVWEKHNTWPDSGLTNAITGIGIMARHQSSSLGNWYGVTRNGPLELTVDLGVAADSTWRGLGWRATSTGIQFMVWSSGAWVDTGTETAWAHASMPDIDDSMGPLIGNGSHATSDSKELDVDLYAIWDSTGSMDRDI